MAYFNLKDTKYEIYFDIFFVNKGGGQLSGDPDPPLRTPPPPPDRNPDVISS